MPERIFAWCGYGFSADGSKFFGGGWPGPTPRVFKLDERELLTYCFRHPWPVAAAFTPDSKQLASIHEDGVLVFWELTAYEPAKQLRVEKGFGNCTAFAISLDGRYIAFAKDDGSVLIRKLVPMSNAISKPSHGIVWLTKGRVLEPHPVGDIECRPSS